KGFLDRDFNRSVIEWARPRGVPVYVDPKVLDFTEYQGATLVKPNRKEIESALGRNLVDAPEWYDEHIRPMLEQAELGGMLITLGELGMAVVQHDHDVVRIATRAHEVYDVTGAGDTVIGVLSLAVASGCDWEEAAEFANAAAGLAVAKVGTASVSRSELARALSPGRTVGATTLQQLVEEIGWWRLQGKSVVFTNGCFDVLHMGHLQLLRAASALGDVLVVGLNDDDSVRRLKGEERPVVPGSERAELLASLDCVDAVVMFAEDTPAELVRAVQPDVLVKGGDYRPEDVVGRDTVEARGGRVEIVPLVPGRSTSKIVEKLRSN
ncbi:MAG: D-glycero-beta-D-manno-heptose 1-phosphate adenylyltransferase, partial [Myxococcota bacterium]